MFNLKVEEFNTRIFRSNAVSKRYNSAVLHCVRWVYTRLHYTICNIAVRNVRQFSLRHEVAQTLPLMLSRHLKHVNDCTVQYI